MKLLILTLFLLNNLFSSEIFKPLPKVVEYNKNIVKLGKELFFDPSLSKNKDISCFTCHNNYGVDNKKFSIGSEGKVGFMNSPSVFNLKYKSKFFWNGRVDSLAKQMVDGPLFNAHEMASDREIIEERIKNSNKYKTLFMSAYNSKPSFELLQDALMQFQLTLISSDSKFDKYLRGEVKLSKDEQSGLELFISYGCSSCHNGINLGGNSYQKFGSIIPFENKDNHAWDDRYEITKNEDDKMVFIVPSLRNIEKTFPYFHSGEVATLKEAIKLMGYHNIGIILKDDEINKIEAFLKTLTGKKPLTLNADK